MPPPGRRCGGRTQLLAPGPTTARPRTPGAGLACYAPRVLRLSRALLFVGIATLVACGHKPPYKPGDQPESELLLGRTAPQLRAIAVPDATITLNRLVRADLAMVAQADARFRGSVTKAGNELVTLAFSEEGYALRYKLDDIPTGYYSGPADPCAVQAMLGVPLSYDGLVALVLGGAPVIANAEIVKQKWDRRGGYESLILAGDGLVQELRFAWVGGSWLFAGGQMWQGDSVKGGRWLWSMEHDRHRRVGDAMLPGRTKVRAPGKRRDTLVIISYKDRVADPPWSKTATSSGGDGGDDGGDDGGWENSDDDGGWENSDDDGGWENSDDTSAPPAPPAAPPDDASASPDDPTSGGPEQAPPPSGVLAAVLAAPHAPDPAPAPAGSPVPAVFRIDAAGLSDRGDLCR